MITHATLCSLLLFLGANFLCVAQGLSPSEEKNVVDLIQEGNVLAIQLYAQVKKGRENTVFSPYAAAQSMALPFAGSEGSTESQMNRILRFRMTQSAVGTAFKSIREYFGMRSPYNVVCGIWLQKGAVSPAFHTAIEKTYGAALRLVDFAARPENVRLEINGWMREKTQGRITDIVPRRELQDTSRMVVVSGAYIKGKWEQTFDLRHTKQAAFFFDRYVTTTVPTMFSTAEYYYANKTTFSLIELPYEATKNDVSNLSLFLFLPHDTFGLVNVEKELTADKVSTWIHSMEKKLCALSLPRFDVSDAFSLVSPFTALGITNAFSDEADFSGIREKGDLKISQIFHKASYSVSEWGSEGGISLEGASKMQGSAQQAVSFAVNHPFLFMVIDKTTGCILLIGRIVRPE